MSQQDDVEVISEAFERWNKHDIDHWIEHAHPQVEIWSKYAALESDEPYRGHEGMRMWRAEIDRDFDVHEVFAEDIRAVAARILVLGAVRVHGRASGAQMQYPFGWVCEMNNGVLFFVSHVLLFQPRGSP